MAVIILMLAVALLLVGVSFWIMRASGYYDSENEIKNQNSKIKTTEQKSKIF